MKTRKTLKQKQCYFLFLSLTVLLVGCGNRNSKSNQENYEPLVEQTIQKPRNKNYVGREIPVRDNPDSDFKIVKAQITGTFKNPNSQGYEIRFWVVPKKDITVFNSQYQTQWGNTEDGRLLQYDISNYYLFLRFVTSEGETINCDMIAPYSNFIDYVDETTANPKFYSKAAKNHPAGELCHEEGTRTSLHIDKFGLIDDLDHIEFIDIDDYSAWLFKH